MMTVAIDRNAGSRTRSTTVLALLMLTALTGSLATVARADAARRIIPLTINKGQNYTITGVQKGAATGLKVISNPNALVVQNAPGRIELVGADAGRWKINVTLATGEQVTYVVTVKSDAPSQGILVPATAPTAIP
jgi:hypothetical protein